ncbi:hypothetical protein ND2E_0756 [Colwellia psychrerythraea]|uniref:Uncharacterized protein n=1 Tax=Colwellia psychrerythraea TaxID=28229 RepID=A0A099K733_COLPS|nr:hypothetical protein ND2E_0756 [Colwellia psychrerythraea]
MAILSLVVGLCSVALVIGFAVHAYYQYFKHSDQHINKHH